MSAPRPPDPPNDPDDLDNLPADEDRLRRLVENTNDVPYALDAQGRVVYLGPQARRYGLDPAAAIGRPFHELLPPQERTHVAAAVARVMQAGEHPPVEFRFRDAQGRVHWLEENGRLVRDAEGRITGISGLLHDVTARKQAEQALRESEEKYRALIENATDGIVLVVDGRIEYANRALLDMTGYEARDLIGELIEVLLPDTPLGRERVLTYYQRRMAGKDVPLRYEAEIMNREGRRLIVEVSSGRVTVGGRQGVIAILKEVTLQKQAQQALIRSERLAAVGTLAGGVAHEFNNINVSILGFIQLALERPDLDPELKDWLERVARAAQRAGQVTRNLLAFSQPGETVLRHADLVRVVGETVALVRREFETEGIRFDLRLAPVPATPMDAAQIGQVVLNFLINARHAMQDRPDKTLTIETGHAQGRVYARFRDTGCGIDPENLRRIFSPFFTTKGEYATSPQPGVRGTGLGLSISHTIATEHGGDIDVDSTPGQGATFTLWLPVGEGAERSEEPDRTATTRLDGARILVLDDEPDTCDFLELLFERHGARVRCTDDGARALSWVGEEDFDLVLVDLQMPKMTGTEFLNHLARLPRDRRPVAAVITGRSTAHLRRACPGVDLFGVIEKPFDVDSLCARAHEAVAAARARRGAGA